MEPCPLLLPVTGVPEFWIANPDVLPPLEALRTPLAPSERREIAFELALPPGQPLVLAVGPFSFEIRE